MARIPGFVGPSNTLHSVNADAEDTINWMYEPTSPGGSNYQDWMPPTPGLRPWLTITSASPVRGLFEQDGRAWAVIGGEFREVFATTPPTSTLYGMVAVDGNPPTICSNGTAGHQLFITSGGNGYIFDTIANTLVQITDPDFPTGTALMGEFMDGYFLVLLATSRAFQISELEDGLIWDALDVGERSEGSDNLLGMIRSHREIWFLGSKTGEVWFDNGDPDFPFAPIQGVFIEQGTVNGFTMQRFDNTIMWIGKNQDGRGVAWRADGYTPKRLSTHAIELFMQAAGFAGVRTWEYQQDGHLFYVLVLPNADLTPGTLPSLNGSPVYDIAVNSWHKRARWDSTHCVWLQYVPQCHMAAFDLHLVGDRFTGTIYEMSPDLFTEELTVP